MVVQELACPREIEKLLWFHVFNKLRGFSVDNNIVNMKLLTN